MLAALQQNSYSKEFIQRIVKKHNRRKEQPRERPEEEPKQTKSINLPYIQGVSEELKRALNKHNIKATFNIQHSDSPQKSIIKTKGPHTKGRQEQCCIPKIAKPFTWEIQRTLNVRAEEHITAIKSASKKSHTAEHCWKYNHHFDWEHKKILDFEKNWKTRTIKESVYSEENEHHINGISFKLPNIWKPIL